MAQKRPSDSLVLVQETKRSKNELATYTAKDKALALAVRKFWFIIIR